MLERLNVFLGGCGGKGAQDGDCIEMYYYYYYFFKLCGFYWPTVYERCECDCGQQVGLR